MSDEITTIGTAEFNEHEAEAFFRNLLEIERLSGVYNILQERFSDSVSKEEMDDLDLKLNKLYRDIAGLVKQNTEFTRWAFKRFLFRHEAELKRRFPDLQF